MSTFIKHQETYSRLELVLRTFFGVIYIVIPHFFLLIFIMIGAMFVNFIAFWIVLFTAKYPRGMWDYMVNMFRWNLRVSARINNLSDGYPSFGLNGQDENTDFKLDYPERLSRGLLLARVFFGFIYIIIPHGFCLLFLSLAAAFVRFIAFWIVLITAKYPKGMHDFMVGVIRWSLRVGAYYYFLTDTYPPFSLDEVEPANKALDQNL